MCNWLVIFVCQLFWCIESLSRPLLSYFNSSFLNFLLWAYYFPNNWQLFWALCAVGCFDMCYAISWSTWNKYPQWLSTMLYISLCLCYFRTNGGLFAFWVRHESCTFFFLGQGRSFILSCHLNMQPIFLLPCSN